MCLTVGGIASFTAPGQPSLRDSAVEDGAAFFTLVWSAEDGAGPLTNAQSCAACHSNPRLGGGGRDVGSTVLISDEELDDSGGHLFRQFLLRPGRAVVKRPLPRRAFKRRTPSLLGIGLLEQVPQDVLAAAADPEDRDADGISGRVAPDGGRFGWKSRFRRLDEAVAAALVNELGLTNPIFPGAQGDRRHVEATARQLADLTAFVRRLPPPSHRGDSSTAGGDRIFRGVGCAGCHTSRLPLRGAKTTIAAYTDWLLHDLGPALADGFSDGGADPAEFRTPPLWGIGSIGPPFLHDGRAKSLDEAIRLHDGEARTSRLMYERLDRRRRAALIRLLESL